MSPDSAQADPVLALLLRGGGDDPRHLYYLWEQQQWSAGKLDLSADATEWKDLEPGVRRPVADSIAWRRLRAEVATSALVPFVDLAPSEEQQVFLTTQLVDEARHLVFFDRVLAEVVGVEGDTPEDRAGLVDDPALKALLDDLFPDLARALREETSGGAELVAAVAGYHVAIVGALGLTDHRALAAYLSELDVLPGIRKGLDMEAMGAHRHVAFGLGFLGEVVGAEPGLAGIAEQALERSLRQVRSVLSSAATSAPAPYPGDGMTRAAESAVDRWLAAVGLKPAVRS